MEVKWYELRELLLKNNYDGASKLLSTLPDLVNARNSIGETVLHYLAVENKIDNVSWLHNKGASLNVINKFGVPVVFEVAQLGYKSFLTWFYENGADFKTTSDDGLNIYQHLEQYGRDDMVEFVRSLLK